MESRVKGLRGRALLPCTIVLQLKRAYYSTTFTHSACGRVETEIRLSSPGKSPQRRRPERFCAGRP